MNNQLHHSIEVDRKNFQVRYLIHFLHLMREPV